MAPETLVRWSGASLIGIVLFSSPVEPVGPLLFFLRVVGALVFGAALISIGYLLWVRPLLPTADA